MRSAQLILTALVAPLGIAAAGQCTKGQIYCGHGLKDAGYTKEQLLDTVPKPESSVPYDEVGVFGCKADNEIKYENYYCMCECVGDQDPNKICSECPGN